jgi:malonate-semialdehyde dehydrogenase (acetylating)/methylmalonate-semialdehyde dehydrogenase
MARWF